jgi:transmembrane sensor
LIEGFLLLVRLVSKRKKMEIQNIPWEAISAKLKNCAGTDELKQIQEWLDRAPENGMILSEISHVWSITKGKPEFYQPDLTYNWNKLIDKINPNPVRKINAVFFFRWVAAAAILVMVFLAGLGTGDYFREKPSAVTFSRVIAPKGNKTQIVLPDSSKVWLNSGAELWYPSNYTALNREVWMKGECYFQVEEDPSHPLVVHGTKLQVKVYGTSFNIREDEIADLSNVTLVSGKVEVMNLQSSKIAELVPGQQFMYRKGLGEVHPAENLEALTSWVNNILIFKNQPFDEVISYLNGWYGVNINFERNLYNHHKYTFKVKTESLREVLELITIITPIHYEIEGDQISIKYKQKM